MMDSKTDNTNMNFWVIRAGIRGNAEDYFVKKNTIVLNEPGFGDLSKIDPTRQSFYEAYRSLRPDEPPTAISGIGGKFFRFIYELNFRTWR